MAVHEALGGGTKAGLTASRQLSPFLVMTGAMALAALLLTRPLHVPLGPMYWDLVLYVDAAHRIAAGQVPLVDFLAPVGPLGYWLYALGERLFREGHPLLLVQFSTIPLTLPVMALALRDLDRRSRPAAFALLLPYLAFQLLPINVEQYSIFPGLDGFGIYNRQVSIVFYAMVAALIFVENRTVLAVVVCALMTALLLIKVTGFVAGGAIVGFAFLAGRLPLRLALAALGAALLLLGVLELASGLVGAYARSILDLVALNAGGILPRFLQAASLHLDIFAAGSLLIAALLWLDRAGIAAQLRMRPSFAGLARLLDRDAVWLAVVMAAGLFFETQNTGGQALIFLWPVMLRVLMRWRAAPHPGRFLVCALVAATAIPPATTVLQRGGRALLAQLRYEPLPNRHLAGLGRVTQNPEVIARSGTMLYVYEEQREAFREIAAKGILPVANLYSDLDFQASWLRAVDSGVEAILAHEARAGRRFETIMSLNFVNPFPALMKRGSVRNITIGADPSRSVPEPGPQTLAAVAAADLVLYPLCPITAANDSLRARYAPALKDRTEIALGPCWLGYVKAQG